MEVVFFTLFYPGNHRLTRIHKVIYKITLLLGSEIFTKISMMKINFLRSLVPVIIFFGCLDQKLHMISHYAYAIGSIDYYSNGGNGLFSEIHYHFSVSKINYSINYVDGEHGWNVPWSCSNCNNGNKFMVQYDSLQPSITRMLFSYQVTDSADYKKYVLLFKKTPPGYPTP